MTDFNPSHLARRDTGRMAGYKQNLDFYRGSQWKAQSRHRQLVFNYSRVAINKITSYLMQGLTVACYPEKSGNGSEATVRRAELFLKEVYRRNNLQQLDWETEIDAAVLGDGCYKVTWDAREKRVRITSPDVSGIYAWWLGDDMSHIWRIASRYILGQDEIQMLYGKSTGKKSSMITELWTDTEFQIYLDNELMASSANPYGFIPFILFPNLREPKQFWGSSDVPAIIQPQRELNRSLSQLSRILELSGNPITILKGVSDEEGNIKVNPGQYWEIPEDADISVLDMLKGGGVRLHIDYIDIIYRAMHDISETPRAAYGGIEKELSGAALRVEMGSLIQKVTRKRTIRTSVYNRRDEMVLRLARQYQGEEFDGITPGNMGQYPALR